jgi:predicted MPP superfamily phosphohydrolase
MILLIGKGIFLSLFILGNFIKIFFLNVRKLFSGYPNKPKSKRKPGFILLFASGISVVVMLVYFSGMIFWVNNFKLQTVEIKLKGLPHEFDGYKIIQLSDLHLGTYVSKHPLDKIVRMVNAERPDLIVFTGDLVNFTTKEALPFENSMKLFSSKDGIFSILGNHDYGEYSKWESKFEKEMNDKALFAFYQRIGWHLLQNQNFIINRDSADIAIVGVENWSLTKRFGKKGDIKKAIRGCEQVQTKILMSHDPSHWDGEINWLYPDICLTLSGHTHAFQFAIETGNYKWSPASILFAQWGGLYEKLHQNGLKQYLYVNRGVGTLGYPGRIATRPEITLIILRSE